MRAGDEERDFDDPILIIEEPDLPISYGPGEDDCHEYCEHFVLVNQECSECQE